MANTSLGLSENIESALAYLLGVITGVIFLVAEKKSQKVRFHAMQSTITFAAIWVLELVTAPTIVLPLLLSVVSIAVWIYCIVMCLTGKDFELPIVGKYAKDALKSK